MPRFEPWRPQTVDRDLDEIAVRSGPREELLPRSARAFPPPLHRSFSFLLRFYFFTRKPKP